MAKNSTSSGGIVVIGLGRFGGAVAQSLVRLGHEVLAIDENADLVQRWSDKLTHVVQADSTDESALRQIGEYDWVLVDDGLSRNGSFVNGERVSDPVDYVMHEHDNIVVGYGKPGSFPTEYVLTA